MEPSDHPESSLQVLIVEDDKYCCELLAFLIARKFPSITVHTGFNGNEGIDLFNEHMPDIVITDINMPDIDGIEMAQIITAAKPDTKIVVITADAVKAALENPDGDGFNVDHYIFKPIELRMLFMAIEQCISEIRLKHPS